MAEVTCPSPFSAVGSLNASFQMEVACPDDRNPAIQTWNPSDKHADVTLSEGNLRADNTENLQGAVRAIESKSSGKWYWEVKVLARGSGVAVGIGAIGVSLDEMCGTSGDAYSYNYSGHKSYGNGATIVAYGNSYTTGDIVGVALDLDTGKLWWAKNNAWQAGGNPAAGTNEAYFGVSGTYFPMLSMQGHSDSSTEARFCSNDQSYDPPAGFKSIGPTASPFITETSLSAEPYPCYVDLDTPFSVAASLVNTTPQQETPSIGPLVATCSGQSNIQVEISGRAFQAITDFSCDHCFNYTQIDATCPTPTCKMAAVFRYARLQAETPTPTASFRVGKRIEGECPVPEFTCRAYHGRNPSIIAISPVPSCSMRVGLNLRVGAGAPVPSCSMVADTHHLATLYGNVPVPTCEMMGDTENIAVVSASAPCPRGLFVATVGNVANIYGRVPCPKGSMRALTGTVVSLSGRMPVPGPLVRFHASLMNVSITLEGDVPVPTMTSHVHCSLPSLILKHIRGEVR